MAPFSSESEDVCNWLREEGEKIAWLDFFAFTILELWSE
jgi:hypothetical protein